MIKIAILTASDKGARGERIDKSSEVIKEMVEKIGKVIAYALVPDDEDVIAEKLVHFCDVLKVDLVLTTGGTGFSIRDVTPEATKRVIEKDVPGIPEIMRVESFKKTNRSILSRETAGIRGRTLIVNLPGSPKAVRENLEVILDPLVHGIAILKGESAECGKEK